MIESLAALPKTWSANTGMEYITNTGDVDKEQPSVAATDTSSCDDVLEIIKDLDYDTASDGNKGDPSTATPTTPGCDAILATPTDQAGSLLDSSKHRKDGGFSFEGRNLGIALDVVKERW